LHGTNTLIFLNSINPSVKTVMGIEFSVGFTKPESSDILGRINTKYVNESHTERLKK
jgi:hypothetical protein